MSWCDVESGFEPSAGVPRFITGSYDRTCKVWDTITGKELLKLEGHKNVVYAIAFNNPYGCVVAPAEPFPVC